MSTRILNTISFYLLMAAIALFFFFASQARSGERRDLTGTTVMAANKNAAAIRRSQNKATRRINQLNQSSSAVAGYVVTSQGFCGE